MGSLPGRGGESSPFTNNVGESGRNVPLGGGAAPAYKLIAELSRSEKTVVTLAMFGRRNVFQKLCVIKRLRAAVSRDPRLRRAILVEADIGARLHHPGVIETYDCDDDEGVPYLVRGYVEGASLRHVMRAAVDFGIFPAPHVALYIIAEALSALEALHELRLPSGQPFQFVHRMISPDALIVGHDGFIRLVDFGGAWTPQDYVKERRAVVVGKSGYMAPEYVEQGRVDRCIDVFSMGVVLWELLARGRAPGSENASPVERAPLPPVSSAVSNVDSRLDELVAKAVSPNAGDRYPTAGAFRDAIHEYLLDAQFAPRPEDVAEVAAAYFEDARERMRAAVAEALGPSDVSGRLLRHPASVMPPPPPPSVRGDAMPPPADEASAQSTGGPFWTLSQR